MILEQLQNWKGAVEIRRDECTETNIGLSTFKLDNNYILYI